MGDVGGVQGGVGADASSGMVIEKNIGFGFCGVEMNRDRMYPLVRQMVIRRNTFLPSSVD